MKKDIFVIISSILLILFLVIFFGFSRSKDKKIETKNEERSEKIQKTLKINDKIINVDVANTDTEREKGLSGRKGLGENEGMLFVFDREGYYGIWMKDMNFPIDITWLDKDKKIIYMEKNVSPETYPKVFYAIKDDVAILSLYVLETPAGFLLKNNIKIGDIVAF